MKKGFVLISTLSIIAILAVLTLFINSMVISSALTISNFNESVEQRIKTINYEKFILNTLQNNSNQLRNLEVAENQLNALIKEKTPSLSIKLKDLNTCLNLNSVVKPFRSLYIKNDENLMYFESLLNTLNIDKNVSKQFIDRLIDYIDSDQLPEPFGVEDLFYIADENLNLTADTLIVHKTQIQDLKILNENEYKSISPLVCALPTVENKFNINSLTSENFFTFSAMFPDVTLDEMQQLIINKPEYGYINYKSLIDINNFIADKVSADKLIYKPEFLEIHFKINIGSEYYYFISVADLKNKINKTSIRTNST